MKSEIEIADRKPFCVLLCFISFSVISHCGLCVCVSIHLSILCVFFCVNVCIHSHTYMYMYTYIHTHIYT